MKYCYARFLETDTELIAVAARYEGGKNGLV